MLWLAGLESYALGTGLCYTKEDPRKKAMADASLAVPENDRKATSSCLRGFKTYVSVLVYSSNPS